MYLCLNKLTSKYGKRIVIIALYALNACKLGWKKNLFELYVEPIAFRIKTFMNETST